MATITEIAKKAGVSQATVSRVVNNNGNVGKQYADQVMMVMNELGYRQKTNVRKRVNGLSTRTPNVAVLILSYDIFQEYSHVFSTLLRSINRYLGKQNLNAIQNFVTTKDQIPPAVKDGHVSGLILAGTTPSSEVLDELKDYPQVWISSRHDQTGDTALAGNELIGQMAKNYLLGRGHKRLGFLCATVDQPALIARGNYFEFSAKKEGVPVDIIVPQTKLVPRDLADCEAFVESLVLQFLKLEKRPTGIFVPMDMQVAMVYRFFKKYGVEVGKDVEIVGCDNDKLALMGVYPRPATIDIGAEAMGRQAVELLLWRLLNPEEGKRVCVSVVPELIPGEDLTGD
jgi:LacI family transcriptional regulator